MPPPASDDLPKLLDDQPEFLERLRRPHREPLMHDDRKLALAETERADLERPVRSSMMGMPGFSRLRLPAVSASSTTPACGRANPILRGSGVLGGQGASPERAGRPRATCRVSARSPSPAWPPRDPCTVHLGDHRRQRRVLERGLRAHQATREARRSLALSPTRVPVRSGAARVGHDPDRLGSRPLDPFGDVDGLLAPVLSEDVGVGVERHRRRVAELVGELDDRRPLLTDQQRCERVARSYGRGRPRPASAARGKNRRLRQLFQSSVAMASRLRGRR